MNANTLTVAVLKQQQLAGTKGRSVNGVGLMLGNTIVNPRPVITVSGGIFQ